MQLSSVFTAIAFKKLVRVDLPKSGSNQHELNSTSRLKDFFREAIAVDLTISWRYFADNRDAAQEENWIKYYDARAKSADRTGRSEWRIYYGGSFLENAAVGDLLIFARTAEGKLFGLIFQENSAWWRAARVLFGIEQTQMEEWLIDDALDRQTLEFVRQRILTELDFELPDRISDQELVIDRFQGQFPKTSEMSVFARQIVEKDRSILDFTSYDQILTRWLQREEELFRALEGIEVSKQLELGFDSVEHFIKYSLSVQNRRKARMGYALQNHLAALFDSVGLKYAAQALTEAKNKPDFIFPGKQEYHDQQFNAELLVMLGAKATCKDRWRQILTEAGRIPDKHLCTLEARISKDQTDEMTN